MALRKQYRRGTYPPASFANNYKWQPHWGKRNVLLGDPVADYVLKYQLDGTDSSLTRVGGDDFRIAPACPEAIGSQFSGSQYFDSTDDFSFGTSACSITFWLNSTNAALTDIISYGDWTLSSGFEVTTRGASGFIFRSNNQQVLFSDSRTIEGNWIHCAIVSTGSGGTVTFYINGISLFSTTSPSYNIQSGGSLRIGQAYIGALDDIRVYDRELSTSEITALYNYRCDFNPSQITTSLWLDAQDQTTITESAGAVSQWDDKSGNNNHATQGTGSLQPLTGVNSINGLNVINYDGTDKYLELNTRLTNVRTLVMACKWTDKTGDYRFIIGDSSSSYHHGDLEVNGTLFSSIFTVNSVKFGANYINGILDTDSPSLLERYTDPTIHFFNHTADTSVDYISADRSISGRSFKGDMQEIIIFDTTPSDADRQKIEGYLAWKWGLVADLPSDHPYRNSPPRT